MKKRHKIRRLILNRYSHFQSVIFALKDHTRINIGVSVKFGAGREIFQEIDDSFLVIIEFYPLIQPFRS